MSTTVKVMSIIERITETEEVRQDPDVALFDLGLLTSLGLVELIVALSEEFGVEISPADVEREQWSSPRKIVAYMENRVGA